MTLIKLDISGDTETAAALAELPVELEQAAEGAGMEVSAEILGTVGVQAYPPATAANAPPTPYYIRGLGTQYASRNLGNSEQYGKRWTTEADGYTTVSKNTASYGPFLVDDLRQAGHMALIGWRKLGDVATEKKDKLIAILEGWIDLAIEKLGLGK
ncbi:hypothetical protein LCGC14_1030330 [marine sediment metagenome]|uniref:HK97 gp10 family phage protein n=1 Tax=marine sediment metagenome TaxID=412755 RepID=A0A0F9MZB7_9ZZZZ